jgi:hypothetical protein
MGLKPEYRTNVLQRISNVRQALLGAASLRRPKPVASASALSPLRSWRLRQVSAPPVEQPPLLPPARRRIWPHARQPPTAARQACKCCIRGGAAA